MSHSIEQLIETFFEQGCSDVFIESGKPLRYRLNGGIGSADDTVISAEQMVDFWKMCGGDPDSSQEYDKRHQLSDSGSFVRVNLYRTLGSHAAALRPVSTDIPDLDTLGLPAHTLMPWFMRESGLILVTGAAGAGKSTTLAAALQGVAAAKSAHILTIEDPIEYLLKDDKSFFSQRELGSDTDDFASALRASLRQNPDIIFVGEIRDEETANIALRAAESGHLVVSTLHSSGTIEAIERLTLLFKESQREGVRKILSQQLIGICFQELLATTHGGVMPIIEVLQNDSIVQKWINEQRYEDLSELLERENSPTNVSFLRSLVAASSAGFITQEQAQMYAKNPHDYNRIMSGFE